MVDLSRKKSTEWRQAQRRLTFAPEVILIAVYMSVLLVVIGSSLSAAAAGYLCVGGLLFGFGLLALVSADGRLGMASLPAFYTGGLAYGALSEFGSSVAACAFAACSYVVVTEGFRVNFARRREADIDQAVLGDVALSMACIAGLSAATVAVLELDWVLDQSRTWLWTPVAFVVVVGLIALGLFLTSRLSSRAVSQRWEQGVRRVPPPIVE